MSGRPGIPEGPAIPETDPRIPLPIGDQPTACKTNPAWFSHDNPAAREVADDIKRAKTACSGCPVARACLLWALAHPDLAGAGIWAATTPRQRTTLRRGLIARLGPNWVNTVAAQEEAKARRRKAARGAPASVQQLREQREQRLARLELEAIPSRPPAPPPYRPVTEHEAAAHRHTLAAALRESRAA